MPKGIQFKIRKATVAVDVPGYKLVKMACEWADYGVIDDDVYHEGGDGLFVMVEFRKGCHPSLYVVGVKGNSSKQDLPLRDWYHVLADRGIDTIDLPKKIRRHTRRIIDTKAARRIIAARV